MQETLETMNSFEFILEVLDGCPYSCAGCHVKKNNGDSLSNELLAFKEEASKAYSLFSVGVGPTDIFTANNTTTLFENEVFVKFITSFERLVVNSTLLRLDVNVLSILSKLNMDLQINVVVPENKLRSDSYVDFLASRIEEIKKHIPDVIIHPQVNIEASLKIPNLHELNKTYQSKLGLGIDFNMSFLRANRDPEICKPLLLKICELIGNAYEKEEKSLSHFDIGSFSDKMERVVLYYDTKFFIVPVFSEDYVQPRRELEVSNFKDFQERYLVDYHRQLDYAAQTECETCPMLTSCIERRSILVMELNDIDRCPFPTDKIFDYNQRT